MKEQQTFLPNSLILPLIISLAHLPKGLLDQTSMVTIGLSVSVMLDDSADGDTSALPIPSTRLPHEHSTIPGDEAMYNNILLLRDGLDYLEFRESIRDGDPGRTFEIVKVYSCNWLSFSSVH
jgi:hypothetical protein